MKKIAAPLVLIGALSASPCHADDGHFYISGELGGFYGSDSNMQQVYGFMPLASAGVGVEFKDGARGEADLIVSGGSGTPINLYNTSGLSSSSSLTIFGIAVRLAKAFGEAGNFRPYLGIEASYDFMTETINATYQNQSGSVSGSGSGLGIGAFGGIDVPLTKSLLLDIGLRYNYNPVTPEVNSSSGQGTGAARSSVDVGGISFTAGLKNLF